MHSWFSPCLERTLEKNLRSLRVFFEKFVNKSLLKEHSWNTFKQIKKWLKMLGYRLKFHGF